MNEWLISNFFLVKIESNNRVTSYPPNKKWIIKRIKLDMNVIFFFSLWVFTPVLTGGFYLSLTTCQFSRTLLGIIANRNYAVVRTVSIPLPISIAHSDYFPGSLGLFQRLRLWLVSPSAFFSVLWQGLRIHPVFRFPFTLWSVEMVKSNSWQILVW